MLCNFQFAIQHHKKEDASGNKMKIKKIKKINQHFKEYKAYKGQNHSGNKQDHVYEYTIDINILYIYT